MVFDNLILRYFPFFGVVYSGGLLLSAYYFQYFVGLKPCQMCIWQRWPHYAVIFFCLLIILKKKYVVSLLLFAALSAFTTSIIGIWHSGVELEFFYLPEGCSSSDLGSINTVKDLINKPMISCNIITWKFLGLSMTNWNTILSLIETLIFLYLAYFIKYMYHEKK
tara:strand:- start:70 stop:564 length:495 start_codon:yes stop_codon:yes gene_type:complete